MGIVTREQKLALVLGFASVLVVGLLLSDHFAAANAQRLDAAPDDSSVVIESHSQGERLSNAVPIPQDEPATHAPPGTRPQPSQGDAMRPTSAAPRERQVADAPRPAYLVLGQDGGVRRPSAASPSPVGRTSGGSLIEQAGRAVAGGMERLADSVRDAADAAGSARVDPLAARSRAIAHRLPDATAQADVVHHHVREGETLYEIAQRYYGKGAQWRRIARDNPGRVGEDGLVRKGVLLRIHEPTRTTEPPATGDDDATPGRTRTYTVRPNDTLGEIAQRQLGTVRRQDELLKLNRQLIDDPDELRPGMVLRLPTP